MSECYPQSGSESLPGDNIDVDYFFSLTCIDSGGQSSPLDARFRYSQHDPYAVKVLFLCSERPVEWTFGRELLIDGVYRPTGIGDVVVWPTLNEESEAYVAFTVNNISGNNPQIFMAPTREMMLFLDQTLDLVPQGFESLPYERTEFTIGQLITRQNPLLNE